MAVIPAIPATIAKGARANATPVAACLTKEDLTTLVLLVIGLKCCGGHPPDANPSFQLLRGDSKIKAKPIENPSQLSLLP